MYLKYFSLSYFIYTSTFHHLVNSEATSNTQNEQVTDLFESEEYIQLLSDIKFNIKADSRHSMTHIVPSTKTQEEYTIDQQSDEIDITNIDTNLLGSASKYVKKLEKLNSQGSSSSSSSSSTSSQKSNGGSTQTGRMANARPQNTQKNSENTQKAETYDRYSWPNEDTEEIGTGILNNNANKILRDIKKDFASRSSSIKNDIESDYTMAELEEIRNFDDTLMTPKQSQILNQKYNLQVKAVQPNLNLQENKRSSGSSSADQQFQYLWNRYTDSKHNYVIPYYITESFKQNSTQGNILREALQVIQDETCIRFYELNVDQVRQQQYTDFIIFLPYASPYVCLSHIGRIGGKQPIFLG